jgi:hypothetical protein
MTQVNLGPLSYWYSDLNPIARQVQVVPSSNVASVRYATIFQPIASSATPDATAFIPSSDNTCEGVQVGNVVAVFSMAGRGALSTGISYNFTGNGNLLQHYVANLIPNKVYTLTGATSGTVKTTNAGVATFGTTGSGTQMISIS